MLDPVTCRRIVEPTSAAPEGVARQSGSDDCQAVAAGAVTAIPLVAEGRRRDPSSFPDPFSVVPWAAEPVIVGGDVFTGAQTASRRDA